MDLTHVLFVFSYFYLHFQLCQCYQKYKLESYKLCQSKPFKKVYDLINPPDIVLGNGGDSAVILTQTWNATNQSRLRSFCSFEVKSTDPKSEFYVVITKLKMRRSEDIPYRCYDYIQFRNGGPESEEICDEIGTQNAQIKPIFGRRINKFHVDVNIKKGLPIINNEQLELEMIITSAHECRGDEDDFQCNENDSKSCISKKLIGDGIMNCFPPCIDEGGCEIVDSTVSEEKIDISSIALSAITSLVFTMIAVVTCAWACWKYKDCVRTVDDDDGVGGVSGEQNANQSPMELPQSSPAAANNQQQQQQSVPTAPPPIDLPPSYESLFPDK